MTMSSNNNLEFPYHLLPQELVIEILLKLPPKSLIRFKSVCKSWCSLISDPQFLTQNLLPYRHDCNLLVKRRRDKTSRDHTFSLLSNQSLGELSQTRPLPYPELSHPLIDYWGPNIVILGSCCNGLVCLYDTSDEYIVFWNLESGELKILPDSNVPNPPGFYPDPDPYLGFGYDANTNDYKVIRINELFEDNDDYPIKEDKFEIYSLKEDCWRAINGIDGPAWFYTGPSFGYKAYVDGIFMWLGKSYTEPENYYPDIILWFRFSDEVFGTIMLPANAKSVANKFDQLGELVRDDTTGYVDNTPRWTENFLVLNDRYVALIVFDYKQRVEKCFHVWVLLEFGVKDSWTRLFTIGPLVRIERPIWFWNNGKMIMENSDGQLVVFDPFTREMRLLDIGGLPESLQIIAIEENYTFLLREKSNYS